MASAWWWLLQPKARISFHHPFPLILPPPLDRRGKIFLFCLFLISLISISVETLVDPKRNKNHLDFVGDFKIVILRSNTSFFFSHFPILSTHFFNTELKLGAWLKLELTSFMHLGCLLISSLCGLFETLCSLYGMSLPQKRMLSAGNDVELHSSLKNSKPSDDDEEL